MKESSIFSASFAHSHHESAVFKGASNLILSIFPKGFSEVLVALIAGVMRSFERVVALPDPKDIEFPQPH